MAPRFKYWRFDKHWFVALALLIIVLVAPNARCSLGETREQLIAHYGEPQQETDAYFWAEDKNKELANPWRWIALPWYGDYDPALGEVRVPGVKVLTFKKDRIAVLAALRDGKCVAIEYNGRLLDQRLLPGPDSMIPTLLKASAGSSDWPKDSVERLFSSIRVDRNDHKAIACNEDPNLRNDYRSAQLLILLICDASWPKLLDETLTRAIRAAKKSKSQSLDSFDGGPPDPKQTPQIPTHENTDSYRRLERA
jgi:hypothetical protein